MTVSTAAALIIGNEILSGKTEDTNTPFLARELRALGVTLSRVVVVPDEEAVIRDEVRALSGGYDCVFTSGGVGPTHDDVTLRAVAAAFERELVTNPDLERAIREHFDVVRTPAAMRMAEVPAGAEMVYGDGLWIPVVLVDNVYVLPGLPPIFRKKVVALRDRLRSQRAFHLQQLFLTVDEVEVADALAAVAARHGGVDIGSYPEYDHGGHRVKLTFDGVDPDSVAAAVDDFLARVPDDLIEGRG